MSLFCFWICVVAVLDFIVLILIAIIVAHTIKTIHSLKGSKED